jgi:hypothetical protein
LCAILESQKEQEPSDRDREHRREITQTISSKKWLGARFSTFRLIGGESKDLGTEYSKQRQLLPKE